jgi:hypothetical protein
MEGTAPPPDFITKITLSICESQSGDVPQVTSVTRLRSVKLPHGTTPH